GDLDEAMAYKDKLRNTSEWYTSTVDLVQAYLARLRAPKFANAKGANNEARVAVANLLPVLLEVAQQELATARRLDPKEVRLAAAEADLLFARAESSPANLEKADRILKALASGGTDASASLAWTRWLGLRGRM